MEKISKVTEDQHMIPHEITSEADELYKAGIIDSDKRYAIVYGIKNGSNAEKKNIHPLMYEFHQKWIHGNGNELKNVGDGGIWNKWWKDKRNGMDIRDIDIDTWNLWRQDCILFIQAEWIKYLKNIGVK